MFSYCGNNPTSNTDPTGHAFWGTNTVAICDGGNGLSTTEYQYMQSLLEECDGKISMDEYGVSPGKSATITKRKLVVDVSELEMWLMGKGLEYAGEKAESFIDATYGKGSSIIVSLFPSAEDIIYAGMPVLPNGSYTIYEVDAIVNSIPFYDSATGNMRITDFHMVTTFYVLDEPTNGWITGVFHEKSYYSNYR